MHYFFCKYSSIVSFGLFGSLMLFTQLDELTCESWLVEKVIDTIDSSEEVLHTDLLLIFLCQAVLHG